MANNDIYEDFQISSNSEVSHPTTSYSRPFLASSRGPVPTTARMGTAAMNNASQIARLMTSKQGAGFSRAGSRQSGPPGSAIFDPLNQAATTQAKQETKPEEKRKEGEIRIYTLLTSVYDAYGQKNYAQALDFAKEAWKKEKQLNKELERYPQLGQNPDLSFCVLFALGNMYQVNRFYQEALNTFQMIVKSSQFQMSGRMRVNMGTVYMEQGKYTQAVKLFQMALDSIPNSYQQLRTKVSVNIAICQIRMSQIQDAITCFSAISETNPTAEVLYNLLICHYALGDVEKMMKTFQKLVYLPPVVIDDELDSDDGSECEVFQDELRDYAKKRIHNVHQYIINSARLIAPLTNQSFEAGFDWAIETVKSSPVVNVADDIELAKAIHFIRIHQFSKAMDLLKDFERKGSDRLSAAATNLSALMYGMRDEAVAEKYAEIAVKSGRFNSHASNNLAICEFARGNVDRANEMLRDVLMVDSHLVETIFNFGLSLTKAGNFVEALKQFEKLNELLPQDTEVIYHIADIHEKLGNDQQAIEWLSRAISINPTDPTVLMQIGKMHSKQGDKAQAFHYYSEAYRYYPDNIDLLTWLGGYYVESESYELAIQTFYRASLIHPREVKWQLMIASCIRRSGNYQHALERYKKINEAFPESIDCLRFLVRLCSDMGVSEFQEYSEKLASLERKERASSLVPPALDGSFDSRVKADHSILTKSVSEISSSVKSSTNNVDTTVKNDVVKIKWDDENVESILPD